MIDFTTDLGKLVATGLFGLAVALVALLGSLVGAFLSAGVSLRTSRKTLFVNTVTSERAKWRQDLRTATGELVRHAQSALFSPNQETIAKLNESRVAIRLRLNPSSDHKHVFDQTILAALRKLMTHVDPVNKPAALTQLEIVEENVQKLLKQEWDKSKREAQSGRLEV